MVVVSKLSTAAILLTWIGFTALKGNTNYVYSHADTNLISCVKIMNILSLERKNITWLILGTGSARGGPWQSGSCHEGHFRHGWKAAQQRTMPCVWKMNSPCVLEAGEQDATHPRQNTKLAILSIKTRLADQILTLSNSEDHHSTPGDALLRSRKHAWIVRASTWPWCWWTRNNGENDVKGSVG